MLNYNFKINQYNFLNTVSKGIPNNINCNILHLNEHFEITYDLKSLPLVFIDKEREIVGYFLINFDANNFENDINRAFEFLKSNNLSSKNILIHFPIYNHFSNFKIKERDLDTSFVKSNIDSVRKLNNIYYFDYAFALTLKLRQFGVSIKNITYSPYTIGKDDHLIFGKDIINKKDYLSVKF